MIPKVIHRVWLREEMPEPFRTWGTEWRRLHPGWTLIDWHEPPDIILPDVFWNARELCDDDWVRWEADVLRLVILYTWGGVYVDTDIEPLRNLEPLLAGRHCVVGRSPYNRRGKRPITNAFMAAEPNHPYLKALVDGLDEAAKLSGDLAWRIGPWHLTRTFGEFPWAVDVIDDLYEQDWFRHHWNSGKRRRGEGLA